MWDSCETRLVQRSALRSGLSSPRSASPDPEEKEQWRKQLEQLYSEQNAEAPTLGVSGANTEILEEVGEAVEEAYDFRLFSSKHKDEGSSAEQLPRIVLRSPSPGDAEAGFVRPRRTVGYYFTGAATLARLMQYRDAAIEGDDVLRESGSKWAGFELPWRVTTVRCRLPKPPVESTTITNVEGSAKKRRNGKKRRIAIRMKLQARQKRDEVNRMTGSEKAVLEREKKNKRNREKKIKRREKARNQKKAGVSAGQADHINN